MQYSTGHAKTAMQAKQLEALQGHSAGVPLCLSHQYVSYELTQRRRCVARRRQVSASGRFFFTKTLAVLFASALEAPAHELRRTLDERAYKRSVALTTQHLPRNINMPHHVRPLATGSGRPPLLYISLTLLLLTYMALWIGRSACQGLTFLFMKAGQPRTMRASWQ